MHIRSTKLPSAPQSIDPKTTVEHPTALIFTRGAQTNFATSRATHDDPVWQKLTGPLAILAGEAVKIWAPDGANLIDGVVVAIGGAAKVSSMMNDGKIDAGEMVDIGELAVKAAKAGRGPANGRTPFLDTADTVIGIAALTKQNLQETNPELFKQEPIEPIYLPFSKTLSDEADKEALDQLKSFAGASHPAAGAAVSLISALWDIFGEEEQPPQPNVAQWAKTNASYFSQLPKGPLIV